MGDPLITTTYLESVRYNNTILILSLIRDEGLGVLEMIGGENIQRDRRTNRMILIDIRELLVQLGIPEDRWPREYLVDHQTSTSFVEKDN